MARDMVRVPGGAPSQQYQSPKMRLGRSQFDLSKNHKTTFDASVLVPYFLTEVVPGDTHTVKLNSFLRIFAPLGAPIMDNIHVSIDYFFVPSRILWNNWEGFLGAHTDAGAQDVDFTIPILTDGSTVNGGTGSSSMNARYMGIPVGLNTSDHDVNVLPFRAYNMIYNEWYRDQNLIDRIQANVGDGPDALGDYPLQKSAKKPDYFTTALPYLQKGDPVEIPLLGTAPVKVDTNTDDARVGVNNENDAIRALHLVAGDFVGMDSVPNAANLMYADLGSATGISINALREAAALQRLLERDARGGTRHPEIIRAHFGVDVPDHRSQRPEYLGGGTGYINVSPVANTSATASEEQGQLTGIGTGTLRGSFAKSFVEHGYIMGILRARGEVSYSQGLERMWSRSTKYDLLWPDLSQLGEQPIYNREIFISNDSNDDEVFGYQERYADYRFGKSLVTGQFAPGADSSLDFWHLSEEFSSLPGLNAVFIEDQTPMDRIVAVADQPDFIIDGRFDHKVARALPVRPTPTLAPARF